MVVCVGGVGSGKSLLLSTLSSPSFPPSSSLLPTVGVNLYTLPSPGGDITIRWGHSPHPPSPPLAPLLPLLLHLHLLLLLLLPPCSPPRELGGALAPAWPSHLAGETRLLYLVGPSSSSSLLLLLLFRIF